MTADTTLTIGPHTLTVEYETARRIVQTCAATGRRGGLVPVTADLIVWVTQATPLSVHRTGQYANEYTDMLNSEPPRRESQRGFVVD